MIRSDNLLSRQLFQTKMPHQLNNTMKGLLAIRAKAAGPGLSLSVGNILILSLARSPILPPINVKRPDRSVDPRAQDAVARFGIDELLGPGRMFRSVEEAIRALRGETQAEDASALGRPHNAQ